MTPGTAAPAPQPTLLRVEAGYAGLRADAFLGLRFPLLSRTRISQKIQQGEALLNGRRFATSARMKDGDQVTVFWRALPPVSAATEFPVLFEDDHLIAVDKPAGVAVHPTAGIQTGTVIQFVKERCAGEIARGLEQGDPGVYPGLVNRLDMFSSGIVLVAERRDVLVAMQGLQARNGLHKTYTVLVTGALGQSQGMIELPLGRDDQSGIRVKMAARPDGLPAATGYSLIRRVGGHSLLHAFPTTGRQHQVRAHFAAIGHPVWGDLIYADEALFLRYWENGCVLDDSLPPRHCLHAEKVRFAHPVTGIEVEIVSPLPEDFRSIVRSLG